MKRLISMEDAEAQLAKEIIDRQKLLMLSTEEEAKQNVRYEITARLNRLKKLRTQRRCDSCEEPLRPRDIYVIQSEPGYRVECYDCVSRIEVQRPEPIVGEPHDSYELCVAENAFVSCDNPCVVIRCETCGLTRECPQGSLAECIFVCDGRTMQWYHAKTSSQHLQ
jgi:hypothetical protein